MGGTTRRVRGLLVFLGSAFLVAGVVVIGLDVLGGSDSLFLMSPFTALTSFGVPGVIMLLVAKSLGGVDTRGPVDGLPGTGRVTAVRDTGMTLSNVNAVFEITAMVTNGTTPPYEAKFKITVNRAQWGMIQPGTTVPVVIDRNDPNKVSFDSGRPVVPMGAYSPMAAPGGQQQSSDAIIAAGVPSEGVLQFAAPTGMTAGQVAGGLPADRADDPLMHVLFTYTPMGGSEMRTEAMVRVPDGKYLPTQPGTRIPIRYLPNDPSTATIDWSRL